MLVMLLAVAMRRCEAVLSSEHFDKNWFLTLITFPHGEKKYASFLAPRDILLSAFLFFNYSPTGMTEG